LVETGGCLFNGGVSSTFPFSRGGASEKSIAILEKQPPFALA
jgi:hypothetical protein